MSVSKGRPDRYCRIVAGAKVADVVYESATVLAFRKRSTRYQTHIKVIPKRHISSLLDVTAEDGPLLVEMVAAVLAVARLLGPRGFRIEMNSGSYQNTPHLHWHLLVDRPSH